MTKPETVRYEMLARMKDFGAAHAELFPEASVEGKAMGAIGQAVAEIEAQSMAKVVAAAEGRRAKAHARTELWKQMTAIARTARGIGRLDPAVRNAFVLPRRKTDVALMTLARVFIREGESLKERFAQHRLPATSFAGLQQLLDTFEAASRERRTGRSSRTEAQADIVSALARGLEAARTLDVVMANVLAGDPGLLAAWKRDRRIGGGSKSPKPADAPVVVSPVSLPKAS